MLYRIYQLYERQTEPNKAMGFKHFREFIVKLVDIALSFSLLFFFFQFHGLLGQTQTFSLNTVNYLRIASNRRGSTHRPNSG